MANTHVKSISLADLKVSSLNMRHGRKKPDVSDILPSIRTHGVRQSLLVRAEGGKFGVIAGRRRLVALRQVAKETDKDIKVPCIIMKSASEADAIEASLIENVARVPATEMEQYTAFNQLHGAGRSVEEIAEYYGVTPLKVKRVLALANLQPAIREAYTNGEIDPETIRALTLASEDQQTEWVTLYNGDGHAPRGRACRAWITGGDVITTDKALFDLEGYEGDIVTDLFGDHGVFADAEAFWAAQAVAVSERVEAYTEQGWSNVHVLERGAYFQSWEHEKCPRTKGGHVYIELRHNGDVTFLEGYITNAEARRREKTGANAEDAGGLHSEMTGPMAIYIARHRHAAAGASLLSAPSIALRLMVAHAMTGSALWDVRPQPDNIRKESTAASLENASATRVLNEARDGVAALFKALETEMPQRGYFETALCEAFSALLAMSDDEVMQVLSFTMARTLIADSPIVEALLHVLSVDLSGFWSPDDAFFELLRDKRVINALLEDAVSEDKAKSMLTDTGKVQKGAIQSDAPAGWRPGWMQVPPSRVLEGAQSGPTNHWEQVAHLFETDRIDSVEPQDANAA
ncbi:MAG: ParB/RepB/Spo0J family partition protein [Pseudomonadota bacterium]